MSQGQNKEFRLRIQLKEFHLQYGSNPHLRDRLFILKLIKDLLMARECRECLLLLL